jgi:hypothetical protein
MNEHLIIRAANLLGIEIKPEVMLLLLEKMAISLGINAEPAEPKEQPEPNFATAWDDAAIESIVGKCFSYILEDFDLSRIDAECLRCGYRNLIGREDVLASEIRSLIKGVFLGRPNNHCSNFILNRFEQSVIRSIAVAHRDYDHWNESNELK